MKVQMQKDKTGFLETGILPNGSWLVRTPDCKNIAAQNVLAYLNVHLH